MGRRWRGRVEEGVRGGWGGLRREDGEEGEGGIKRRREGARYGDQKYAMRCNASPYTTDGDVHVRAYGHVTHRKQRRCRDPVPRLFTVACPWLSPGLATSDTHHVIILTPSHACINAIMPKFLRLQRTSDHLPVLAVLN